MPRTPKPALRKPKPRSPRPTSRLPISAHGICPFRAPSFFLRNFFSALCADAAPLHRCRADAAGSGTMGIRPPRRRRRSPGSEVRVRVRGRAAGQSPGRGFWSGSGPVGRVRVGVPSRASGRGCEGRVPEQGSACRIGPSEAGAGRRFLHRGIGCSPGEGAGAPGRDSESLPEDRLRGLRFRGRVSWSAAGSVDGSGSCGCFRGPGAAADSGAGFRESRRVSCSAAVPKAGFRGPRPVPGACAGRRFPGSDRGLPKAFRLRRIFPRTEAFSAAHERRRGNPRSAFPSGGGPGSAESRVPGAGAGCGRFLRRPHPAAENRGNPASPVKKETFQTGFVEEL